MGETVFVTGATGFIAKHIILQLLNAGYQVVGSVRSMDRAAEVRDAVTPHLKAPLGDRLRFAVLDLTRDAGWAAALKGVDALMHTASPFPMTQPDNADDLIRPAVDGALRALKAAQDAGVKRVVLTSSVVAVAICDLPPWRDKHTEEDWTDIASPAATPYAKSKTLAERAAWKFAKGNGIDLTTINPGLVLGPPLDDHYGTSIGVVERILRAKDPMLPRLGFAVVDVRDVAKAHLRALTHKDSIGKRIIVANGSMWLTDLAKSLKASYPNRKIVTRQAPDFVVRLLAKFDKAILPGLGTRDAVSNERARKVLGMEFINPDESLRASADYLINRKIV